MNKKNVKKGLVPYVFLLLLMLGMYYMFVVANSKVNELTYDEFIKKLADNEVTELKITPRDSYGVYDLTGKLKKYEQNETFFLKVPLTDSIVDQIITTNTDLNYTMYHYKSCRTNEKILT